MRYSGEMEVKACERLLNFLISVGLCINAFSSDWSTTIRKLLAEKFKKIKHQNDPWYVFINQMRIHSVEGRVVALSDVEASSYIYSVLCSDN